MVIMAAGCADVNCTGQQTTGKMKEPSMKKATGVGGVFFKSGDPEGTRDWYARRLGLPVNPDGYVTIQSRDFDNPKQVDYLVWSPFPEDTDYFGPDDQQVMINYRVADLDSLLESLRAANIEIVGEVMEHEYGRFAWIIDPEGRRIELWEPKEPTP